MQPLPSYRVTTRQRLSWLTQETLLGAALPLAMTPVVALSGLFAAPLLLPLCGLGAAIGAVIGRSRTQRENDEGKIIPPPTYFNKKMVIGLAMGIAAMTGVGMLAGAGAFLFTAVAGAEFAISAAAIAYLATGVAGVASAAYFGAVHGKHQMDAEYHYAKLSGTPIHAPSTKEKPQTAAVLEAYDELEAPQKRFVAEEMERRQQRGSEAAPSTLAR